MPITSITWTSLTNAVINGSGDLEKNAGSDNCFTNASGSGDAGARSTETVTEGDWGFECTLGPVGGESGRTFIGIQHGTFSLDFADWDYCVHVSTELNTSGTPHPVNSVFIYEGAAPNKTYRDGIWQNSGQKLQIICLGGVVRYYLDCVLLYTSPTPPTYPLYAVVSLACLNKTVISPLLKTGGGAGSQLGAERGSDANPACAEPWVIPSPTAFPLPAAGGPQHAYFSEAEIDWGEFTQEFPDGVRQAGTIQASRVRIFEVRWTGLDLTDLAVLDAHWQSTRGGLPFTLTHPLTSEVINNVRYLSYGRSPHRREWSQDRTARLVKYTN